MSLLEVWHLIYSNNINYYGEGLVPLLAICGKFFDLVYINTDQRVDLSARKLCVKGAKVPEGKFDTLVVKLNLCSNEAN